jgi:hypothetical protein
MTTSVYDSGYSGYSDYGNGFMGEENLNIGTLSDLMLAEVASKPPLREAKTKDEEQAEYDEASARGAAISSCIPPQSPRPDQMWEGLPTFSDNWSGSSFERWAPKKGESYPTPTTLGKVLSPTGKRYFDLQLWGREQETALVLPVETKYTPRFGVTTLDGIQCKPMWLIEEQNNREIPPIKLPYLPEKTDWICLANTNRTGVSTQQINFTLELRENKTAYAQTPNPKWQPCTGEKIIELRGR